MITTYLGKTYWIIVILCSLIGIKSEESCKTKPCKTPKTLVKRGQESQFNCKFNGDFKDPIYADQYWHCDVDKDGGFVAIRKRCPLNHIFDSYLHECVARSDAYNGKQQTLGTESPFVYAMVGQPQPTFAQNKSFSDTHGIINSRAYQVVSNGNSNYKSNNGEAMNPSTQYRAYPNSNDCHSFYLCYANKNKEGYERLKLNCPRGTAFDGSVNKCTKRAMSSCKKGSCKSEKPGARSNSKETAKRFDGFEKLLAGKRFKDVDIFQKRGTNVQEVISEE